MSSRTVRLDEEAERILAEIRQAKRLSVSGALKQGLVALRESLREQVPARVPYDVYKAIDVGPGGYSRTKARHAKAGVRKLLRKKARR